MEERVLGTHKVLGLVPSPFTKKRKKGVSKGSYPSAGDCGGPRRDIRAFIPRACKWNLIWK